MYNASIYRTVLGLFWIFYCLDNFTVFSTRPSSPRQFYHILTPSLLNISKCQAQKWYVKRPVKQLRTKEKVLPFQEQAFSAFYVSRCRPPSHFWSERIEAHALILHEYSETRSIVPTPLVFSEKFRCPCLSPPACRHRRISGPRFCPSGWREATIRNTSLSAGYLASGSKRKLKKESSLVGCQVGF